MADLTSEIMPDTEVHPVQTHQGSRGGACISTAVTKAAYEVYCHVYAPQDAIMTGSCRGGFSAGELIGFLYARSFPKEQWRQRVEEAFNGMKNL